MRLVGDQAHDRAQIRGRLGAGGGGRLVGDGADEVLRTTGGQTRIGKQANTGQI